jgi:AcrR family transcriptional regulator
MLPAPAPTHDARNSSALESARRPAQRERILDAAIDTIAREGHAEATVGKFVERAGVSRPTFYEYFTDKDACVTGAVAAISEELHLDIDSSLYSDESGQTTRRTVELLTTFCRTRPTHACVLFVASLAGPPATLDARATGIARIARTIDSQRAHDLALSAGIGCQPQRRQRRSSAGSKATRPQLTGRDGPRLPLYLQGLYRGLPRSHPSVSPRCQ